MKGKICAVIPAAGKGTRLGFNVPKILVEFNNKLKVIDILLNALIKNVDKILIIVSRESQLQIQNEINKRYDSGLFNKNFVELVIQHKQIGMGDAVFCAYDIWKDYENIIVIWGDQASISEKTVSKTISIQCKSIAPCFTIPLVKKTDIYVEYILDKNKKLEKILQKREGDILHEKGYSDVAVFCLSTKSIFSLWKKFLVESQKGRITKEVNFLPFFIYLTNNNWKNNYIFINDVFQTVGLNTPEEFIYLSNHLKI